MLLSHRRTLRWLCSPSQDAQSRAQERHWNSVVVAVRVAALWRCSQTAVKRWHLSSSDFVADLRDTPRQLDRSIAADPSWTGLMSHHFKFSSRESLNRLRGRLWFRLPDHQVSRMQLAWQAVLLHPDDVPCPTKLGLGRAFLPSSLSRLYPGSQGCDLVLPADAKEGNKELICM